MQPVSKIDPFSWLLRCGFVAFLVILNTSFASEAQDKNDAECTMRKLTSVIKLWSWEDIRKFNQRCCRRDKDGYDKDMCDAAYEVEKGHSTAPPVSPIYCIVMYIRGSPQKDCLGAALTIGFDNNSTNLTSLAETALKRFVEEYVDHTKLKLHIVGHANHTGSEEYSRRLSRQRAEVVAEYLTRRLRKLGFRVDIYTEGVGWASPLGWGLSEKDGLQRRVEISIDGMPQ